MQIATGLHMYTIQTSADKFVFLSVSDTITIMILVSDTID